MVDIHMWYPTNSSFPTLNKRQQLAGITSRDFVSNNIRIINAWKINTVATRYVTFTVLGAGCYLYCNVTLLYLAFTNKKQGVYQPKSVTYTVMLLILHVTYTVSRLYYRSCGYWQWMKAYTARSCVLEGYVGKISSGWAQSTFRPSSHKKQAQTAELPSMPTSYCQ